MTTVDPATDPQMRPRAGGHRADRRSEASPATTPRRWLPVGLGHLHRRCAVLPRAADLDARVFAASETVRTRLCGHAGRPEVLRDADLLLRGRSDHDRVQPAAHRPDRVLGPAAPATPPADRRVRHGPAVRHPADHPRLRPHPHLQQPSARADRHGHGEQRPDRRGVRRSCRSRTCTDPSIPVSRPWTSAPSPRRPRAWARAGRRSCGR